MFSIGLSAKGAQTHPHNDVLETYNVLVFCFVSDTVSRGRIGEVPSSARHRVMRCHMCRCTSASRGAMVGMATATPACKTMEIIAVKMGGATRSISMLYCA